MLVAFVQVCDSVVVHLLFIAERGRERVGRERGEGEREGRERERERERERDCFLVILVSNQISSC